MYGIYLCMLIFVCGTHTELQFPCGVDKVFLFLVSTEMSNDEVIRENPQIHIN